jgi:death on curing protein
MAPRSYPTVAETIEAHQILIAEFGGRPGIRDVGLLESAISRPQSGYYADVIEEAAALMESLANNHAFIDGNKRVSFTMTDTLLRLNGYYLEVDGQEAHKFITQAMEAKEFRFSLIRDWIKSVVRVVE